MADRLAQKLCRLIVLVGNLLKIVKVSGIGRKPSGSAGRVVVQTEVTGRLAPYRFRAGQSLPATMHCSYDARLDYLPFQADLVITSSRWRLGMPAGSGP